MANNQQSAESTFSTKRCPECYTYMPLHTNKCPSCNARLGSVEKHGMARRTTNWSSYGFAFIALLALGIYIWWAFFSDRYG